MKRFLLILSLSVLACVMTNAQTRTATVRGVVVDSRDNTPLLGALVMIDSTRHVTANAKGQFSVAQVPMKSVKVVVSYLGYKTETITLDVNQATENMGTIKLIEEGSTIDMVTVEARSTIATQKGDTIQYNASAFKTNPDADAGDLASKMPGLTIADGNVQSQGEDVKRVYVDGKLFFGDDPMAALKNLPADAVESIQMFDELSDEAKFIGYNDGKTSRALNIVTKHKVNRSTVGRIEAGYGLELEKDKDGNYPGRYLVGGNFNTFTDKNRWSINAIANNVNVSRFAMQSNSGNSSGGGGGFGSPSGLTTINSIGMNYSGDWGKKIKFTGSYFYDNNNSKRETDRVQNYFPTEQFAERIYRDTSISNTNSYNHRANMRFEYQPGKRDRILFTPNASISDNNSLSYTMASNSVDGKMTTVSNTENYNKRNSYNIGGQLLWTHSLGETKGRAITTSLSGTLSDNNANGWQLDTDPASSQYINLLNTTNGWSHNMRARINYAEPISESSRLLFNYTIRLDDSKSEKMVVNKDTGIVDGSLTNSYTRNYLRQGGEVGYSYNKNKVRFNASLEYEVSDMQRQQNIPPQPEYNRAFYAWLPQVEFRYDISKTKNLRFGYEGENGLPSVEDLQNVIDNSNPLQLTAGNPNLNQSYSHNISLRYSTSNLEKSTNFFLMLRAGVTQNSVAYKTTYFTEDTKLDDYNGFIAQAGSQLRTPENMNGASSLRVMTSYSFPLGALKTNMNIGAMYSFTRSPSYTNATKNVSNGNSANLMLGFVSNISSNVDFNITSMTGYSYATNTAKENTKYLNENVTARLNIIFLKGFVFNTDYSYRYYYNASSSGFTQSYSLWNAGIGRKFLKRRTAEVRVTMYDILKQNKNLQHNIADNYIQDSWTNTLGRYVMATFSYRFNSMNALSKPSSNGGFDTNGPSRRMEGGGNRGGGMGGGGYRQGGGFH